MVMHLRECPLAQKKRVKQTYLMSLSSNSLQPYLLMGRIGLETMQVGERGGKLLIFSSFGGRTHTHVDFVDFR